jgi:four helix bundle protein
MYHDFQEMPVWKLAMDLAFNIFKLTDNLPRKEDYGLTSQIRRSALSVSDNIAEGFGRAGNKDKQKFYIYSRSSVMETRNQLIYGNKVDYFETDISNLYIKQTQDIVFELNKIIKSLNS